MPQPHLRNVAIVAHVDHGKTTLVDGLLYQSGQFRSEDLDKLAGGQHGLIMDSNDLERERGITILSKNCAVTYHRQARDGETERRTDGVESDQADSSSLDLSVSADYRINLIDTPGHADFGGEVERVLRMADGVLLLVDAFEGPMPQTRFVLSKALELGLKPVVVINKIDRPDARPDDVATEVFDLLVELEADDAALDFPIIYASAKEGWATADHDTMLAAKNGTGSFSAGGAAGHTRPTENATENDPVPFSRDLRAVFEAIVEHVPPPKNADTDAPLQMLITTLDYSEYVGRIGIGRVFAGTIQAGQTVAVINRHGETVKRKIGQLLAFEGLGRKETKAVEAGDLCAVVGLDPIDIGDTLADPEQPAALPTVKIDEPTLSMTFRVNDSPFAGREGRYVTSRQVWDRLQRELQSNVALRVERASGGGEGEFLVSGRGLMHLGVLIENMRREGYELAVGKPQVILKEIDGRRCEPIEQLVIECPADCQSAAMSLVGDRRAELVKMDAKPGASGYVHMVFTIPARGLIGLRTRMLTATAGRAIMHHNVLRYEPVRGELAGRAAGVMIASDPGQVTPYSLDRLYDRGVFFVKPTDQIYEGQVVGEHCKDNDIAVNLTINKKGSAVRTHGKDDNAQVKPPRIMSLEACLEYIETDELVEVTPQSIRMRKRALRESDRRKQTRDAKNAERGRAMAGA